jgi:hypothetical protein
VSETRKDPLDTPLDRRLLKALGDWPTADKTAEEWEQTAAAIEEKCVAAAGMLTSAHIKDEKFFDAPLPQTKEEGHNSALAGTGPSLGSNPSIAEAKMSMSSTDRERTRSSLKDLARLAQEMSSAGPSSGRVSQPTPLPGVTFPSSGVHRAADSSGNSGIVDMNAIAKSDPSAAARAQSTPLASTGLFDDEAPLTPQAGAPGSSGRPSGAQSVPPPSVAPAPVSGVPGSAPLAAAAALQTPVPPSVAPAPAGVVALPQPKKSRAGTVIGIVFGACGVAAVAAGVLIYLQVQKMHHAAAVALAEPAAPTTHAAPPPVAANDQPSTDTATPAPSDVPDPTALPLATAAAPQKHAPLTAKKAGGPVADAPAKPAATIDPKLVVKDTPAPPRQGPSGTLGDAMRAAAGPSDTPQKQEEKNDGPQFAPGSVPQKPSQGAVTGALGAVLPGARACLGPDDPVSRATVVFNSNGTVQSVSVHGGAAGKPAEGCIKAALGKAKVPPFAESSYSANITVRPN